MQQGDQAHRASHAEDRRRDIVLAVVLILSAPAVGWLVFSVVPEALLELPPPLGALLGFLLLGLAVGTAGTFGFLAPGLWHILGFLFGAPALWIAVLEARTKESNLWPISVVFLVGLVAFLLLASYFGGRLRRVV